MENSKIQWCDNTFNPWEGCTKVSPECANCYAETRANRWKSVVWGPNGTRRVASESKWKEPIKWNRAAGFWWCNECQLPQLTPHGGWCGKCGKELLPPRRPRVFCASLADVFEDWRGPMVDSRGRRLWRFVGGYDEAREPGISHNGDWRPLTMQDIRVRLFKLIQATQNLDYLLLTKRIENVERMVCEAGYGSEWPFPNVWLGTSVGNQERADSEIPKILKIPAAVRFLSVEPQLGPIDFNNGSTYASDGRGMVWDAWGNVAHCPRGVEPKKGPGIDWVICGGESGHGSRPFDVVWARSLRDQCKQAGVAFFLKQFGSAPLVSEAEFVAKRADWNFKDDPHDEKWGGMIPLKLIDKKGGNPAEWPEDLRDCREFPTVNTGLPAG
jgi:protein gp37